MRLFGKHAQKLQDPVAMLLLLPGKRAENVAVLGVTLPGERGYGVGMFFFPQNDLARRQARSMFEIITRKAGLKVLAAEATRVSRIFCGLEQRLK